MSNENILHKIKALLEKTEANGCSQAEAENAAGMAATLMAKYGIEMRQVETKDTKQQIIHQEQFFTEADKSRFVWMNMLAGAIAKTCFCYVTQNQGLKRITFFGTKAEIEVAQELFFWLSMQITFISAQECAGKGAVFSREFTLGCAMRVARRLLEKFEEEVVNSSATAIVRTNEDELKAYAADLRGINTNKKPAKLKGSSSAFYAGYAKGDSVSLDKQKEVSGGTSRLPKALGG